MIIIKKLSQIYWNWKVRRGLFVLESLDGMMKKAGYKRHERRQFWRGFIKKQSLRDELFRRLQ